MNKVKKNKILPRLRFPEFLEKGEWERLKLSELLYETKQRNRNLKYSHNDVLSVSGEYGCVNQIELLGRSYAGVSVKEYHVVEIGDIVYTKSPLKKNPYGIIKENKGKPGIVSTLYAVYRATDKGHPTYLDHYFSNDNILNSYLQPIVRKGAKNDMKVNNFVVLGGEIFAPQIPEQQKIASCLSSLDDLITTQSQKLETLKAHKKGLMQQLFPAKGETVPKLRFKEFRYSGEWEEKGFGDICTNISSGKDKSDSYGVYELYGSTGVIGKTSFGTYEGNFILVARVGANAGFLNRVNGRFGVTDNTLVIFLNSTENIDFIYYSLDKFGLNSLVFGSGQPLITGGQLKNICIYFPQPKEQQKIANCLSSLGELISAQSQKIEALKIYKKGLMQGLFPNINAVNE